MIKGIIIVLVLCMTALFIGYQVHIIIEFEKEGENEWRSINNEYWIISEKIPRCFDFCNEDDYLSCFDLCMEETDKALEKVGERHRAWRDKYHG